MEAGCKGFWRHYGNIDALAEELGISPFTPYTSSAFYSPKGKEVEAPVLGDLPRLPTPFGTLLYTYFAGSCNAAVLNYTAYTPECVTATVVMPLIGACRVLDQLVLDETMLWLTFYPLIYLNAEIALFVLFNMEATPIRKDVMERVIALMVLLLGG